MAVQSALDAPLTDLGQLVRLDRGQRHPGPQLDVHHRSGLQVAARRQGEAEPLDQVRQRIALEEPALDVLRKAVGPHDVSRPRSVGGTDILGARHPGVMSRTTQVRE
ncbi:hypothetical protein O1L44_04225 [Streptomyces noursei]|nr:hypothetical protein [Streptomyces noursei]